MNTMRFVGVDKASGRRVRITDIPNLLAVQDGDYLCPVCDDSFALMIGEGHKPYFAHLNGIECNVHEYFDWHPRTEAHHQAKNLIADFIWEVMSPYTITYREVDVPIPMEWRSKGRVADVMLSWHAGYRVVFEIQLEPIKVEELKARTQDYLQDGIDVFWWLGDAARTKENESWIFQRQVHGLALREGKISFNRLVEQNGTSQSVPSIMRNDDDRKAVAESIQGHIARGIVKRTFEAWREKGLANEQFTRGIGNSKAFNHIYSGIVGSLNVRNGIRKDGETWKLINPDNIYSYNYPTLSKDAAKKVREYAYVLAKMLNSHQNMFIKENYT